MSGAAAPKPGAGMFLQGTAATRRLTSYPELVIIQLLHLPFIVVYYLMPLSTLALNLAFPWFT